MQMHGALTTLDLEFEFKSSDLKKHAFLKIMGNTSAKQLSLSATL
jgi:hypothetical protein